MADQDHLHHNPKLGTDVTSWTRLAENVGVGPSVSSLHTALMNSEGHRRNILDKDVTQLGIGVEVASTGRLWVTQVFRRPASGAACTSPAATTRTATSTKKPALTNLAGDFNGDGEQDLAVFDPATGAWETRASAPLEMHHFQAVAYAGKVYVLGALTGGFPNEPPIPHVYVYYP
jgi:hypothetical protein